MPKTRTSKKDVEQTKGEQKANTKNESLAEDSFTEEEEDFESLDGEGVEGSQLTQVAAGQHEQGSEGAGSVEERKETNTNELVPVLIA